MNWLALDIGGANIKAADGCGHAASYGFAVWQHRDQLANKLRAVIAESPPSDHLAITMTAELADCFRTKTEGVGFILEAVEQAADGRHTRVYLTNGKLVTPRVAHARPLEAAAANWHALATFCARFVGAQASLLLDVGSTTTDIIPLRDGRPVHSGLTDLDRLQNGQLVYTGVERSPVCALTRTLPYRNGEVPVAQELFATARDAYLLLKDLPESADDRRTADGGPATVDGAFYRLGRMLCADVSQYTMADAIGWAQQIARKQQGMILKGVRTVLAATGIKPTAAVLAGQGEFLGRRVLAQIECCDSIISLTEQLGHDTSRCATAHALAVLAAEDNAM